MLVKAVDICAPYILMIFVFVDALYPGQKTVIHVVAQSLTLEG